LPLWPERRRSQLADCHDDDCKGSRVDPALNQIKNSTDATQSPEEWTLSAVKKLNGKPPASCSKDEPREFEDD
jgi:hypothetical protein